MSIIDKLNEDIPSEAISSRSNGQAQLSYLSGAYVINRLNQVFGQGNWGYGINDLKLVFHGPVMNKYNQEVHNTSYVAQIRFWAKIGDLETSFEEVGYGDGMDKMNPGKSHELAVKEAVTDGVKRAAKNLGMSMGLQLYFKEGAYVGEQSTEASEPASKQIKSNGKGSTGGVPTHEPNGKQQASTDLTPVFRQQVVAAYKALNKQVGIEKKDFQKKYLTGMSTDDMNVNQLQSAIGLIKADHPHLPL